MPLHRCKDRPDVHAQGKLVMAKTVGIERNMTNLGATYFAIGDSLWRRIEYFASVVIFSNIVGYDQNIDIIFHHILIQFAWYDKIDCIRVNCAVIYWYECFNPRSENAL